MAWIVQVYMKIFWVVCTARIPYVQRNFSNKPCYIAAANYKQSAYDWITGWEVRPDLRETAFNRNSNNNGNF